VELGQTQDQGGGRESEVMTCWRENEIDHTVEPPRDPLADFSARGSNQNPTAGMPQRVEGG
jgi:hypothetical protein